MQEMSRTLASILAVSLLAICIACGGGGMSSPVAGTPDPTIPPPAPAPVPVPQTVKHVVVVILQNSSFDHLFGNFPGADGISPTVPGFSQNDAAGKAVTPFLLTDLAPPALKEGRTVYSASIDGGLMDKYALNNGDIAMGYFDGSTSGISTIWSYAQQYALADKYFSSVIGEAPANQLYMIAADDNNFPFFRAACLRTLPEGGFLGKGNGR